MKSKLCYCYVSSILNEEKISASNIIAGLPIRAVQWLQLMLWLEFSTGISVLKGHVGKLTPKECTKKKEFGPSTCRRN